MSCARIFLSLIVITATFPITKGTTGVSHSDFIIVGGGTAGCTIAARLCSRLPAAKIIIIERGLPRNSQLDFVTRAPRKLGETWLDENLTKVFQSEPDPGLVGRNLSILDANTLGGSSAINAMQWGIPLGDTLKKWRIRGLSSRVAERFFRRVYWKVGFAQLPRALRQIYGDEYADAATRTGFANEFEPFKTEVREAIWEMSVAVTKNGRRRDACLVYLKPALRGRCEANLQLIQGTTVSRVLLDNSKVPRAVGVEYVDSADTLLSDKKILHAKKEVILSAGPFGSPKLLQVSGIGPRKHLAKANVDTKVDLPVGQKTQSRALGIIFSRYLGRPLEPSNNSTILESQEMLRKWRRREPSVLGKTGFSTMAVLNDIAYAPMSTANDAGTLDQPILQSYCLPNPASYGYLRIRDKNPFTPPKVLLNPLGSKKDIDRLWACTERFLHVHNSFPSSFKLETVFPTGNLSEALLRQTTQYSYHFVGGCAVGPVLRGDLTVKGVKGLRVIDASVFRSMPISSGPMASTYMLAEFASEQLSAMYSCELGRKGAW